jgi:hypothetical protein
MQDGGLFPKEEFAAEAKRRFEIDWLAHLYVPPWLLHPDYPAPRFPRLRWALRRIWPLRKR